MKTFDFEAALAGKPVVNGSGELVIITKLGIPAPDGRSIISQRASTGAIIAYHPEDGNSKYDPANKLFMAPTTVTKWMNIFADNSNYCHLHDSEESADAGAADGYGKIVPRVGNKAHPITYEE